MFWQFENGLLVNLNILNYIECFDDAETGLFHVRGRSRDGLEFLDLFMSQDEERAKMVLHKIADSLARNDLLVRARDVLII